MNILEVRLSQYADGTTALLANVESISRLFDLLSRFIMLWFNNKSIFHIY